jgi:hypothetical protein
MFYLFDMFCALFFVFIHCLYKKCACSYIVHIKFLAGQNFDYIFAPSNFENFKNKLLIKIVLICVENYLQLQLQQLAFLGYTLKKMDNYLITIQTVLSRITVVWNSLTVKTIKELACRPIWKYTATAVTGM